MNIAIIIILAVVAVIDLWLVFTKRPTISHRFQALFPTSFDIVLLVTVVGIVLNVDIHPTLKVLLGVLLGHVAWPNKECHGSVVRHIFRWEK